MKTGSSIWQMRGILMILVAALIIVVSVLYNDFISEKIYEESSSHLVEVYRHVDHALSSFVERNWHLLNGWSTYLTQYLAQEDMAGLQHFVAEGQSNWGFTEFLFLDDQGYCTLAGEQGLLRLNHQLTSNTSDGRRAVIHGTLENGERMTIFASYIPEGVYDGFAYTAIALSYDSAAITDALDMTAFDHHAGCYVVTPAGDTLFSAGVDECENHIEHLAREAQFERGSTEGLRAGLAAHEQGTVQYQLGGAEYYMAYLPITTQDWMLLGVVPSELVGVSIDEVRWVTIAVMAGIFLVAFLVLLGYLYENVRHSLHERDLAIQYRDQLFRTLIQNTNDIFFLLPADSLRAEYVSPNVEEVLGLPREELQADIGQLIRSAADEEQHYSAEALAAIPLDGSRTLYRLRLHQRTGEYRWYRETLYHLMIEDREKFVLVMSDRTQERQNREQLEQALDIAKSANESKSMFLSSMSHDIRTPMNAILGFVRLLERDAAAPEKVLNHTRKIAAAGNHLLSLINDVLDVSKIESGKTSLNEAEFRLPDLLEGLNTVLLPQAKAKNQSFSIRVEKVQHDRLLGDQLRINQILLNLLSNAIKYTPEGGTIELYVTALPQTSRNYSHLRFVVSDNGIGMSEEFLAILFEPFSREKTEATNKIQGTGLGMAIAKNLVDLMGGTIAVESTLGEGSVFTLELELRLPEEEDEEHRFWSEHGISHILVADGDIGYLENTCYLLADRGLLADEASDGEAAVSAAARAADAGAPYDLILLDWRLGAPSSAEIVRTMRTHTDTPILVCTGEDWTAIRDEALAAGASGYLAKPFFLSALQGAVRELQAESASEAGEADGGPSLEGIHFLAAEDNEINAEILIELLDMEGASCDIAENGQIALEKFTSAPPGTYDMILMDIQMPIMDGYAATRAIRESAHPEAKRIPIAAMTANAFAEDVRNAMEAGMDAHIVKPVDMDILSATVQQLLAERHKEDEGQ